MLICERCGLEHDGTFGSGRFCSRSCANARNHSIETRKKISMSVKKQACKDKAREVYNKKCYTRLYHSQIKKVKKLWFIICASKSKHMKLLKYPGLDFGDRYVITDYGTVIRTDTQTDMHPYHRKNDPYVCMCLTDINSKQHSLFMHRIVAYNFIPNPNNYPIINHKDENPANNRVENLEWCTHQYNNTYNDRHIRIGKKASETIRRNGGPWNKGISIKRNE